MTAFTILTATYRSDLERFLLLRESMRASGLADMAEHVCVVHTEDLELFRGLPADKGLEFRPTSDFIEPRLERRRAAVNYTRTRRRHYVRNGVLPGWYAQQLTKLAAAAQMTTSAVLVLDSDLVQVAALCHSDIVTEDGRGRLFVSEEERGDGAEGWNRVAARFLGHPEECAAGKQYIHAPYVFDTAVLRGLLSELRARRGSSWQQAMQKANAFEYPTYGLWASRGASPALPTCDPLAVRHFSHFNHLWNFERDARDAISKRSHKFISVQSRLHVPPGEYSDILLTAWRSS